jgi:hypothetical protein
VLTNQKIWEDSLSIDMLLSAVSVLVVALPSLEVMEGLTNYPVCDSLRKFGSKEEKYVFYILKIFSSKYDYI